MGLADFNANPEQENLAQISRWSLNSTPSWAFPPLAIANQYHDHQTNQLKRARYRLILVRGSDFEWLKRDRLQEVQAGLAAKTQLDSCTEPPVPGSRPVWVRSWSHALSHICMPAVRIVTRRVTGRSWHRPAPTRKSYLCQTYISSMDGGYIQC